MSSFLVGELVGSYRIIDSLGQGGMASVYRAYHARLDRYVAIKVMHPAYRDDTGFMIRFQREAQIVARLEHPNIVPIYDYSEHQGQPYLVMKYIEGQTLKAQLRQGSLPAGEAVRILNAVSQALTYAHHMDILHRDIKPSNILMERSYTPYLADFGLARIAASGESTLSQDMILGTPQYMSPEQAQGIRNLDARADIYSLGIVLYEMLTGHVPFNADSAYTIIHDHIYAPLPLPSLENLKLTPVIDQVLLKALAKDRNDRYDSAVALATAFNQAVNDSGLAESPAADPLTVDLPTNISTPISVQATSIGLTPTPMAASGSAKPGTGNPITPYSDPTPAFAAPPTLALDSTPHGQPSGSAGSGAPGSSVSAAAERSRQLHHLHRRRNLWVAGGFSGLILAFLIGLFVIVSTLSDPAVQPALLRNQPPPSGKSSAGTLLPTSLVVAGAGTPATAQSTSSPVPATPTRAAKLTVTSEPIGPTPTTVLIPDLSVADAQAQVTANPNDPIALFALSVAESKMRQKILTQTHFDKALLTVGSNVSILNAAMNSYGDAKQPQYVLYLAMRLLSIGNLPADIYAHTTQLLYLAALNMSAADVRTFRTASATLPETPEIDALNALALVDSNDSTQLADALALIKKAQAQGSTLPVILLIEGKIAESQGQVSAASQAFRAVQTSPTAANWMITQAEAGLGELASTLTPVATATAQS